MASQTGRRSKRTPRKKKNKDSSSPSKRQTKENLASEHVVITQVQDVQMQIATITHDVTNGGQENRSPNKRRRIFKPSNKQHHTTSTTTLKRNLSSGQNRTPLDNTTNQETSRVSQLNKVNNAPFTSSAAPYRRFSQNGADYSQRRHSESLSELNPFARSFIPRFKNAKPGASNEYVSREIFEYYLRNRQTNEQFKSKQIMRQGLESILKHGFPHHGEFLYHFKQFLLNVFILSSYQSLYGGLIYKWHW